MAIQTNNNKKSDFKGVDWIEKETTRLKNLSPQTQQWLEDKQYLLNPDGNKVKPTNKVEKATDNFLTKGIKWAAKNPIETALLFTGVGGLT